MHPFLHRLFRLSEGVNRVAVVISEIALAALMLLTVYAVVARYVFHSPSVYAVEVSTYLLLVVAWAVVGWVHHVDRHVSMEALNTRLTGTWKKIADLASELTILIFCAVLIWSGSNVALTAIERGYRSASLLKFPLWPLYLLIVLGGLLLGAVALCRLVRVLTADGGTQEKGD
ncbi:MAG TPA: TRAP transporter small permease [Burkholderiaceae bacterium]|nr:TRAP transporter small permease [Burkholderiaceae bacterium]